MAEARAGRTPRPACLPEIGATSSARPSCRATDRTTTSRRARPGRSAAIALAALVASAIVASSARAHVGHVILRAERYLKLDATDADTRLVVSLMLGEDEGRRVLEAADADRDREVSRAEAEAYLAEWADGLRDELPVSIDGEPVRVEWTDGWIDPIGRVRGATLTIELVAHLPSSEREHAIGFEDRMVRRETFDRTDVAFRAHEGAELVTCGVAPDPEGCSPDLATVRGGAQPDRFVAHVRYPTRSSTPSWAVGAGAAAAIAIAVLSTLAITRRRRR